MERGTVANVGKRGFGYITPDNPDVKGDGGMKNIFYHESEAFGFNPEIDDKVEFEVGTFEGRIIAKNIHVLEETND